MARVRHERSAGGVLLLPFARQLMVALIVLRGGRVLALPKGHIEAGETTDQTAARETFEETGMRGRVIAPLGSISYSFYAQERRLRIAKCVSFFVMRYQAGAPSQHNHEVEGVRLVPFDDALTALSYDGERDILRRAAPHARRLAGARGSAANEPAAAPTAAAVSL